MTLLAPYYLLAAALVAAGVVALHFLAWRRPPATLLPTARFAPDRPARHPSRSVRATDLLLLALRCIAVLLVGTAFSAPVLRSPRQPVGRVVLADVSRAVRSSAMLRDSVRALLGERDVLVAFDTTVRVIARQARDSAALLAVGTGRGSLSAGLVAALRAATALKTAADSLELVIVSPFVSEEWDEATAGIRGLWRGRARLIRVPPPPAESDAALGAVEVRAALEDPIRATASLLSANDTGARIRAIRVIRGAVTAADSQWAADSGHVLVNWDESANVARPARSDTIGAVIGSSAVVVAAFERTVALPDSGVIARWADGLPAAIERRHGSGCIREVAIAVPTVGDLALRESMQRLLAGFAAPCGGNRDLAPMPDSLLSILSGGGEREPLLVTRSLAATTRGDSRICAWLIGAAIVALIAEQLLRHREASS